jgi:hypothetical protein
MFCCEKGCSIEKAVNLLILQLSYLHLSWISCIPVTPSMT